MPSGMHHDGPRPDPGTLADGIGSRYGLSVRRPTPITLGSIIFLIGACLFFVAGLQAFEWAETVGEGPKPLTWWLTWIGAILAFFGFLTVLYGISERIIKKHEKTDN